jgi:hypothetical protein
VTERDGGKEGRRKRVTNGSLSLSLSQKYEVEIKKHGFKT